MSDNRVQIWIWPVVREGEIVPDCPPVELTHFARNVQIEGVKTVPTNLPERVAAKVQAGHALEVDPPHSLSSVSRWTCRTCGDAVLMSGATVYGGVTERTCEQSIEFWRRA